jgi:hypothetical protein
MTSEESKYFDAKDPNAPILMGYKGVESKGPPSWREEFGPGADWNHRRCADCRGLMNPAECPDKDQDQHIRGKCLVWHGWCCSQCGGSKVDHALFEESMSEEDYMPSPGYFYCPYFPLKVLSSKS